MFDQLTKRLTGSLERLRSRGRLTEDNIRESLREVRVALLEADVALPVVRDFIARVTERAVGQEVIKSLEPGQALVKVVHDELKHVLGEENAPLALDRPAPVVILLAGLQGAGKTTTAGKLAHLLKTRHSKKVLLSSCDIYRPAAIDQLETLAQQVDAEFYRDPRPDDAVAIAKQSLGEARRRFADVLILDTAGRLAVGSEMMAEIRDIHGAVGPHHVLVAVDSMTGQDAANTARAFHETLQTAGELLFWSVYLPPPDGPLLLEVAGQVADSGTLSLERVEIDDGGVAGARGSLVLVPGEQGWSLAGLEIERSHFVFPQAWQRWGSGPASGYGLSDLETAGRLDASLLWDADNGFTVYLDLDSLVAKDGQQRFSAGPVDGYFELGRNRVSAQLEWRGFSLLSLPFGQSALVLDGSRDHWGLSEPLEVPLLDGAVVVEHLDWRAAAEAHDSLSMDVHIEPLGLPGLTKVLGWPEFGGRLSGRFPGIRFADNRLDFTGGIDVEAFSGQITVTDLVIERPFGSLPALAAQVEFERLDLAELTGAFNFGHMDGLLSGWFHDLRLLDWRPVAMDARAYTLADAPRRRISQRAVENLSRLGGGAAAGAGLLRMFDEFSYRRAGLA